MTALTGVNAPTVDRPSEVVFRATRRQVAILTSLFAFIVAIALVQNLWTGLGWKEHLLFCGFLALSVLAVVFSHRSNSTRLTVDGIERRAALGRRFIPWADIAGIEIDSTMGSKQVVVHERDWRRTRLCYPGAYFFVPDRDFEAKFHMIGQSWLAYRGCAPRPMAAYGVRVRKDGPVRIGGVASQSGYAALLLAWLAGNSVLDIVLNLTWGHPAGAAQPIASIAIPGAVTALCLAAVWRLCLHASVVLDGDVMRVRQAFAGTRVITAREIRALTTVRRHGGVRFAAELTSGEVLVLPKPRVGVLLWDEHFGMRTAIVRDWWLEHQDGALEAVEGAGTTGTAGVVWSPLRPWLPSAARRAPVYVATALATVELGMMVLFGMAVAVVSVSPH